MTITKYVDYAGVLVFKCPVNRFHCSYTVAIYPWNEIIVSIEIMVGFGLHVSSDHFGGIILLHLQVLHVLTLYYIT